MKIIAIAGKARNGKTTVANMIKNYAESNNEKAIIVNYAGYLKYICKTYFEWNGEKDEIGRSLLQNVGDDMREEYGENFWVKKLMDDITKFCNNFDYVIIDDCRYPNEIIAPSKLFDTYSVNVVRNNFKNDLTEEQKKHKSENALNDYKFNYQILADSGVENLVSCVKSLYLKLKCGD